MKNDGTNTENPDFVSQQMEKPLNMMENYGKIKQVEHDGNTIKGLKN